MVRFTTWFLFGYISVSPFTFPLFLTRTRMVSPCVHLLFSIYFCNQKVNVFKYKNLFCLFKSCLFRSIYEYFNKPPFKMRVLKFLHFILQKKKKVFVACVLDLQLTKNGYSVTHLKLKTFFCF